MTERVALITGASAGIGAELARIFAANGHRLAIAGRREDRLQDLAKEIAATGKALPIVIVCDLERPDAGDEVVAALAAADVEVEYVVNNAGFGLFGRAVELDRAQQLSIIAVNVSALTDLSLRFADSLIRLRGGILNMGSVAGVWSYPSGAAYVASKFAVHGYTRALRDDLHGKPVRVTNVAPGLVETNFSNVRYKGDEEKAAAVYANVALGGPLHAEDVADCIMFALTRPAHVNIDEIVVLALAQASGANVVREP